MTDNKKREKLLLVLTVVLVASVFVYSSVIEPQMVKRSQLLDEYRQKQTQLTKMQADILVKDRIESSYQEIEPLIKSTGNDQEEMSAFSQEFQELNSEFSLKPKMIKFLPVVNNQDYRKILVKVELTGGIRNIVDFISSVENDKKAMKFEKVSFVAKNRDDNIQLSFVLSKVISNAPGDKKNKIQDE